MKNKKEIKEELKSITNDIKPYGFKTESGEFESEDITDDMLLLQGWYEALRWTLKGIEEKEKIRIDVTNNDCQGLLSGEVFNWTYKTNKKRDIDIKLYNPDRKHKGK